MRHKYTSSLCKVVRKSKLFFATLTQSLYQSNAYFRRYFQFKLIFAVILQKLLHKRPNHLLR